MENQSIFVLIFKVPHKDICPELLSEREDYKEYLKAHKHSVEETTHNETDVWIVKKEEE
jgi:hypothetical protein